MTPEETPASHRNGESTSPTEPGWYEFIGRVAGEQIGPYPIWPIIVGFSNVAPGLTYSDLKYFKGKWWGPIQPVWAPEKDPQDNDPGRDTARDVGAVQGE